MLRSSFPAAFHQLGEPGLTDRRFVCALVGFDDVQDGVDERQVGQRLRKVAEVAAVLGSSSSPKRPSALAAPTNFSQ